MRPFLRDQLEVTAPAELTELSAELVLGTGAPHPTRRLRGVSRAPPDVARASPRPGSPTATAAYELAKSRRHVVDFDDLLAACTAAIEGDAGFAAAQRWRFRHLFVDEFQDVNPLQFQLLEAWRGDRWDVFVVGDTHQSIYGWNGAEPRLLDELSDRWPALETIHLNRTHRSSPQVTAAAASVIRAAGLPDRHPESSGPPGPPALLFAHADEVAEVDAIARAIRRRRGPDRTWRDFAVLVRTHQQVVDLDRGLSMHGIPTSVRRQAALLDAPGVRQVLRHLRDDDRPLVTALAAALGGDEVDDPAVAALTEAADQQRIVDHRITGRSFVGWAYANLADDEHDPDAVTISTIHSAKGLEWPVVHVAGCEDGSIPIASARRRSARDEEARLFYVAITRASAEVVLHWARSRSGRNGPRSRQRSPFLEGFEDAVAASAPAAGTDAPDVLRSLRASLRPAPTPDPLLAALRAWRTGRARAARTVPDAVVPDELLLAIADVRPRTPEELAALPGLGPARRSRYGDELLAVVERVAGAS